MRLVYAAVLSVGMTAEAHAVDLSPEPCPFAADAVPASHTATCYGMRWTDGGVPLRSTAAVFEPATPGAAAPVIYLPGGPGDAPVDDEAQPESVLRLFPDRSVITMNPRGVANTEPRPVCTFGAEYWQEDIPEARERALTAQCRDSVTRRGVPLRAFETTRIAADVVTLGRALGLREAGLMSVSYGTEIALHVLADPPPWLRFAILDSVSLPGVLGLADQLRGRDAFLGFIERLCFAEAQCPVEMRARSGDLRGWVRRFDAQPVTFTLGPEQAPWSLDGSEMLDFFAGLTSYPDGAAYAIELIAVFETAPDDAAAWVASEVESNLEFGLNNFALLLETYGDSISQADRQALSLATTYPFDRDDWRRYLDVYAVWNRDRRSEPPFIGPSTRRGPVPVPVLVLSGGVDSVTPVAWARSLKRRFAGLTQYVFPALSHATAFGQEGEVNDPATIQQMACAPRVISAFLTGGVPPRPCGDFREAP